MVPLAALAATVLAGLSTLHVYWAVGGRWGHGATIPERHGRPPFEPGFLATLLVAGLLGPVAPLRRLTHIGAWIIAAVFLLRGVGDFRLTACSELLEACDSPRGIAGFIHLWPWRWGFVRASWRRAPPDKRMQPTGASRRDADGSGRQMAALTDRQWWNSRGQTFVLPTCDVRATVGRQ